MSCTHRVQALAIMMSTKGQTVFFPSNVSSFMSQLICLFVILFSLVFPNEVTNVFWIGEAATSFSFFFKWHYNIVSVSFFHSTELCSIFLPVAMSLGFQLLKSVYGAKICEMSSGE